MQPYRLDTPILFPPRFCSIVVKTLRAARLCWRLLCYVGADTFDARRTRLIVVVLYQDRTAIHHNGLPSAESFLHQEQIGLRDLGSFADSANRETVAHALV